MVQVRAVAISLLISVLALCGTLVATGSTASSSGNDDHAVLSDVSGTGGSYTIVYNSNNSDEMSYTQPAEVGQPITLSANRFDNDGYSFQGWSTSASGPTVYSDCQSVSDLSSSGDSTVQLYAVWGSNGTFGLPAWASGVCIAFVCLLLVVAVVYSRYM